MRLWLIGPEVWAFDLGFGSFALAKSTPSNSSSSTKTTTNCVMRSLALLVATVFLLLATLVSAECPNGCSGNGDCMAKDMCSCYKNYQGNDCADRTCVFGRAHVDTPRGDLNMDQNRSTPGTILTNSQQGPAGTYEYFNPEAANDEAHFYLECSNKGICDRTTGLCTCFDGYEGIACQRTLCPNKCSGHGTCESIREMGVKAGGTLFLPIESAGAVNYDLWDGNTTYGCRCDPWYTGPDCSKRKCKVGVDPLYLSSGNPIYETFVVHAYTSLTVFPTSAASTIRIRMFDFHGESYITAPITVLDDTNAISTGNATVRAINATANALANSIAVQTAINELPNKAFPRVSCEPMIVGANLGGFRSVRTASTLGLSVVCQLAGSPGRIRAPEIAYVRFPGAISTQQNAFVVTTTQQGVDVEWFTSPSTTITISTPTNNGLSWVASTALNMANQLIKLGPNIVLASTSGSSTTVTLAYGLNQTLGTNGAYLYTTTSPSTLTVTALGTGVGSGLTANPAVGDMILTFGTAAPSATIATVVHKITNGDLLFYHNQFFYVQGVYTDGNNNYNLKLDKRFGGASYTGLSGDITVDYVYLVSPPTDASGFYKYVSECSGRGMCATDTGICACFKGYTNDNCNTQNILAL